jgi:PAS domain S-box-containing protein
LKAGEAIARTDSELTDALPVAVYRTDAEGRLTYFNAAAAKLSGRIPQLGTDQWCITWKLFRADGTPLPHDQCPMAAALRGEPVMSGVECLAERPDGTRFWFTPYPAVLHDAQGRITGGVNVLVDITERKAAQALTNEHFRAIVETTPECVKVVARDGTLLHMNSSGLGMVGALSSEDVTGKCVYDLVAPEDRDRFREFNERICGGEKASLEFDIIGLQGARHRMETHAAPLRYHDGTTVQLAITRDITGRTRAERDTLLLRAIVDSSDDAIVSKNLDGIITSWNKGAERLFAYTADEAVGQPITMLIPPDRLTEEPQILSRLRRGERVDHFETVRRRKDGTPLDISLTISPVKDSRGAIIGASKIARDITDRRRAEQAIQTLNAQLSADLSAMTRMQHLSTRLVAAEDFESLFGEIADAGIEITRADMGHIQLLEDGVLKMVSHRGFAAPFVDFFSAAGRSGGAWDAALECRRRVIVEDAATSPVFSGPARDMVLKAGARAVQATPLLSRSGGRVLGVFSTYWRTPRQPSEHELRLLDILARQAADLIERKRAEATLLASERRFRELADAMPQIVWTAGPDGYIDYYNKRWYELTGIARDVFGDASWEPILHPEDVQRWHDSWYAAVASGEPFKIEHRFRDAHEHRWRWFIGRALPIRHADGRIVKWCGSCTDIDDQKRVEDELRRANHDLEQFAYSASHDLQDPLRSVQIFSQLLTTRCNGQLDAEAREYLEYVRNGAARMEALVRDLLTYTQVMKFDNPTEPADTDEALASTIANLAGAVLETGARITSDPLPPVRVHDAHLQQLFQNLIGNAMKYRDPERPLAVHVAAQRQNGRPIFSVSDNGIGIAHEHRERIFGLFKRLYRNDEYSGTGIGLAICQRIVEQYGGRIWVESDLGQGSTFRFTLPA